MKSIIPTAKSFILDAEICEWDSINKTIAPFGTLTTVAGGLSGENPMHKDKHPISFVFDILFYNGMDLRQKAYSQRRTVLKQIIREETEYLKVLEYSRGTKREDIVDALIKTLENNEEGLVIKNPRAPYFLGYRNMTVAVKLKPEELAGMSETVDVLVVGAFWGNGVKAGMLNQFLVALKSDVFPDMDNDADNPKVVAKKFMTVGRVSNGIYDALCEDLTSQIMKLQSDPSLFNLRSQSHPSWLTHGTTADAQPDIWVPYTANIVFEIKAAELIASSKGDYGCPFSFRFPRILRLRIDKTHDSIDSQSRVAQLFTENSGRLFKKLLPGAFGLDGRTSEKRKRVARRTVLKVPNSVEFMKPSTTLTGRTLRRVFDGLLFSFETNWIAPRLIGSSSTTLPTPMVLPSGILTNTAAAEDLISEIIRHGGNYMATPTQATTYVVMDYTSGARARAMLRYGQEDDYICQHDVIKSDWVRRCIDSRPPHLLPLRPKFVYLSSFS